MRAVQIDLRVKSVLPDHTLIPLFSESCLDVGHALYLNRPTVFHIDFVSKQTAGALTTS